MIYIYISRDIYIYISPYVLAAFSDSSNMSFPTPSLSYIDSALKRDFSQLFHFGYKTLLYLQPKVKGATADPLETVLE